jgi:hypothetical protein
MLWSEEAMAQRLNWERRSFDHKRKINIHDEAEFRQQDLAARWLARREQELTKPKAAAPLLKQKPTRPKSVRPPAASFEALDPQDPHHQLAGVDMSRPPW